MDGEFVFSVANSTATPATPITLTEAGLRERDHLQEWVIAHPEILGSNVLVITSEYDRWQSKGGPERHRPDVIGLDVDGHLVVAELKRDAAPDTVDMQAIKYAASASRFDVDTLAEVHAGYLKRTGGEVLTSEQAKDKITGHAELLAESEEALRKPRIVLIAGSFPPSVTATAVWLTEMDVSITLVKVQAYRTLLDTVVTVSQLWPLAQAEDFVVAPVRKVRKPREVAALPVVEWTSDDLGRLRSDVVSQTVHATLDLCAERPDEWVPASAIQQATGREPGQHRGDYGGFGITVRQRFGRSNPPFETKWAAGGANEQYYRASPEIARMWLATRPSNGPEKDLIDLGET
jgi:hypothetical protein